MEATSCQVDTSGAMHGDRVVLDVAVTSNSADQPTGRVGLSINRGRGGGSAIWTESRTYHGTPVRITGPRLQPGRYTVNMQFSPSGARFSGCSSAMSFRVSPGAVGGASAGTGAGAGAGTGGAAAAGGGLPNTGGPPLAFLLLGLGLVAAGGGVVSRSRRKV